MEKITLQLENSHPMLGAAGQRVTLALTPADVADVSEIPEYLAGYRPYSYRADEISPVILTDREEGRYRTFGMDDSFRRVLVKGSMQGAVPEVDPSSSLASYKVVERYIGSFVPRQTQLVGDQRYSPLLAASRRCKTAIMLDREVDAFALLATSGNWASGQITAAAGTGWGDLVSGDPILDLQTTLEKSSQMISEFWMNPKVANKFLRHPSVRTHMRQYMGDGSPGAIAGVVAGGSNQNTNTDFNIPGVGTIKIASAKVKNESTGALQYVLPDVVIAVTVPRAGIPVDGEEIASTYTFRRKGISGTGLDVREFEVDGRGPLGGTMIVVSVADIAVLTANNAGGILTGV